MSARKICSQVVKSSNSSILLRRQHYTNNSKVFAPLLSHQHLASRVTQTADYSQALGSLTKDQAHDLVFRMNDEERVILMRTLEQFNVSKEKDGLECKLRATQCSPCCRVLLINLMNVCTWHADFIFFLLPPPTSLSLSLPFFHSWRKTFCLHEKKKTKKFHECIKSSGIRLMSLTNPFLTLYVCVKSFYVVLLPLSVSLC